MLTLDVKDFGPIASGAVKLRPLTVLIGPNNAGKSYLAMLAYSLISPFARGGMRFYGPHQNMFLWRMIQPYGVALPPKARNAFEALLNHGARVRYRDLDRGVQDAVQSGISRFIDGASKAINEEIQRCFATGINDLRRRTDGLAIALRQDKPSVKLQFGLTKRELKLQEKAWGIDDDYQFDFREPRYPVPELGISEIFTRLMHNLFPFLFTSSYYFPAARSGILQAHKAMASSMLSRLPLVGIEQFDIPKLSGVVADFISNLLRLEKERPSTDITRIGDFLESEVCHGQIALQATGAKVGYPEILYRQGGKKFSLTRTSSMVSEIAPIILFLKYVVNKGNLLIIEEPEAHLHPDNQRKLARAVVRLIRCGVQVLVTTHSDYFVQQLSNFIRMSANPELRSHFGYVDNEFLHADEVAAYLFRIDNEKGSVVDELKVTTQDGVPEDQFVRIAEEIYDESAALDSKLSR